MYIRKINLILPQKASYPLKRVSQYKGKYRRCTQGGGRTETTKMSHLNATYFYLDLQNIKGKIIKIIPVKVIILMILNT